MADTSNNLTFFVQSSIIDDYDLRVAAYQRLILDNDVGISQLVNETTRMQDKKLKQQMQKEKSVAQISLDQIQKKLKKLELQKKQRPMIVSEETEKIMQENVRNKDKLNKIREILGEESEDEIVNVQQERQEDFDLEASNVDFTTKKNVDMSSYIANYGMNKFDYFEKHALSDRDYNLSMIAQPYRSVAYYTHQKIAVPPSYWCFRGKKKEFQVSLCRLQRRWSITSSPMDKVAFLRHAIVSYYTLADLNPLLEQFKIEEELQLKDLGDLFADLQLQKQINEAVAPMKNETKLTLEPSGATLEEVNFLNLNEFNTITVEALGGGQSSAYRIRELYATKKKKGYIVKKDEKEFFFYMEDENLKSRELKQGFELLEALLNDKGMFENDLIIIGDITVDDQQPFEEYMQESIEATLEWAKKQSNTKDAVGVESNLGINLESIDDILKAVDKLKQEGYVKIENKEIVSGTFVKGSGLGTAGDFKRVAKDLVDMIPKEMTKLIEGTEDIVMLKKAKNSGIKTFSEAASARINKLLRSKKIFEVLSYVPRNNRFTFLQDYGVLLVGFQMVTSEINAVLNKRYEDNTKKIDDIFKNDNDILNLYQNFSVENLDANQGHALAHFYYDEKTFLRASFTAYADDPTTIELMKDKQIDDDEDITENLLEENNDNEVNDNEEDELDKEKKAKRKRKGERETPNKKSKQYNQGEKRKLKMFKKKEALNVIRSDLKKLIVNRTLEDEEPDKDVLDKKRWFYLSDIVGLISHYGTTILDKRSTESDDNKDYASFIEFNVTHKNIIDVMKSKVDDNPHILIVNHKEIHWQLLVHKDLLPKKKMELEGLKEEDLKSPYYQSLKKIPQFLWYFSSYKLLKNDADGNCGPHVVLQIIQILYSENKLRKFLTEKGKRVYNTYHNNLNKKSDISKRRRLQFESAGADLNDLVKDNKTVRSKIEEYLNNEQVLDDLQKQLNKTDEDAVTKVMQDLSKIIELVRWSDLDEEDREAYLKKILVKRLFVKGNCGMIPFLCTFGESAVLKYISSMKKYLKNGLSMARQGEYQNFYAENYKDFYNKNKNWENGVKRFNEYRKYKYNIDPHMLQNDRHILACVLENPLNLSAERDFISLESLKPATNWTTIVRMALYEKYNFFMPLLSDTLGGKIFDELVARNAFHDFVYNYCTLYTLIFNDYN